jgi:hypothetical protein
MILMGLALPSRLFMGLALTPYFTLELAPYPFFSTWFPVYTSTKKSKSQRGSLLRF